MSGTNTEAYGDSWYAATKVAAPARPVLSMDLDVDVCVIGGGLAGLTTARELARSGWSVVLLEAGRLAANASGRNTGFVLPGFGADADKLIARVGFERTKDLWSLAQAGLDYVRTTIRAEGAIDADPQDGWLYVSKKDNTDEFVSYVGLLGELGCEIEGWPTERVRSVLRSERIVTPGARLRANHVVLCGNVQLGPLMPRLAATLVPVTTYVITTAPLGERLAATVGYRGGVSDSDFADNHYRVVGGDRLMLSGRSTAWVRDARRYVGALAGDIKKTYPQLGDVAVDYAWSGTLGITVHRMPQIGELGPGVWLASGFGGHGLNTTAMAGNIIARAIVDGDQTWRQFTPFELVWAGGVFGRAVAQMRGVIKRLRGAAEERRAKARELAHRQARDAALASQAAQRAAAEDAPAAENATMREGADLGPQGAPSAAPSSIIPSAASPDDAVQPQPPSDPAPASKRRKRRQNANVEADQDAKA
jgi:glycine/D-amino acid oxidase-like deaminating enzyme